MILVPWWVVLLVVLAVVVLVVGLLASATATRLNRMHIRTDLARASLDFFVCFFIFFNFFSDKLEAC